MLNAEGQNVDQGETEFHIHTSILDIRSVYETAVNIPLIIFNLLFHKLIN